MFRHAPVLGKRKMTDSTVNGRSASDSDCSVGTYRKPKQKKFKTVCYTHAPEQKARRSIASMDEATTDTNDLMSLGPTEASNSVLAISNSKPDEKGRYVSHDFARGREHRLTLILGDERNVKRFSSSNNTKASINPSKPMLHLSWQEVDDHSHSKPTGKSLRHSTSSITDVNQSSLLTPYEKMKQERYEWHQQYSRQQRERMDRDGQIVDQGTGVSVKQLLSLLLRGSVWPDRSPLVVQYWVTQLGAKYTLADCLRQLLISRVKFTYNVNQRMLLFENALSLSIPLELLEDRARLALQALSAAFSVNDATFVIEPRGAAVPRQPFFNTRQVLSEGQSLNTHCGFRFNHVLENLIKVSRIALVRDISCEVLRIGFRVLASSAALDTISCALQQAFLHVQTSIGPLQERALRGCNFDDCLNRKELEQLFTLKEREQMILTLIGCVHRGVLYTLMQQYVSRGEIVTLQIRAPEASSSKTSRPA
jgi:hypothetical protein